PPWGQPPARMSAQWSGAPSTMQLSAPPSAAEPAKPSKRETVGPASTHPPRTLPHRSAPASQLADTTRGRSSELEPHEAALRRSAGGQRAAASPAAQNAPSVQLLLRVSTVNIARSAMGADAGRLAQRGGRTRRAPRLRAVVDGPTPTTGGDVFAVLSSPAAKPSVKYTSDARGSAPLVHWRTAPPPDAAAEPTGQTARRTAPPPTRPPPPAPAAAPKIARGAAGGGLKARPPPAARPRRKRDVTGAAAGGGGGVRPHRPTMLFPRHPQGASVGAPAATAAAAALTAAGLMAAPAAAAADSASAAAAAAAAPASASIAPTGDVIAAGRPTPPPISAPAGLMPISSTRPPPTLVYTPGTPLLASMGWRGRVPSSGTAAVAAVEAATSAGVPAPSAGGGAAAPSGVVPGGTAAGG
ncbi:hypothetical protein BU14_0550s0006, partial [Porphyra umbilicalis]